MEQEKILETFKYSEKRDGREHFNALLSMKIAIPFKKRAASLQNSLAATGKISGAPLGKSPIGQLGDRIKNDYY